MAAKKTETKKETKTAKKTKTKAAGKRGKTRGTAPKKAAAELRDFALSLPGAHEDFPWGERVVKVKGKVFVFMGHDADDGVGLSVKLPSSGMVALSLPFVQPTGYGLGRSGWVSARFDRGDDIPVPMLREWITESYRAVAPVKLVKELDAAAGSADPSPPR